MTAWTCNLHGRVTTGDCMGCDDDMLATHDEPRGMIISDARKRSTPSAFLIAPDADDDPTLWDNADPDRPMPLAHMSRMDERAWGLLVLGYMVVTGGGEA